MGTGLIVAEGDRCFLRTIMFAGHETTAKMVRALCMEVHPPCSDQFFRWRICFGNSPRIQTNKASFVWNWMALYL